MSTLPPEKNQALRPEVAIPVRIPGDLRRRLGALAQRTGRSAADLIVSGVERYVAALESKDSAGTLGTDDHSPLDRFFGNLSQEESFAQTQSVSPSEGEG